MNNQQENDDKNSSEPRWIKVTALMLSIISFIASTVLSVVSYNQQQQIDEQRLALE